MKSNLLQLAFCVVLSVAVALVLLSNSKQPINVHLTCGEIIEGMENARLKESNAEIREGANKDNSYKEGPSKGGASKH